MGIAAKGTALALTAVEAAAASVAVAMATFAGAMTVGVKSASELQQAVANIKSIKPEIDSSKMFSSLNLMQTRVAQSSKQMAESLYNVFSSIDVSAAEGLQMVEKFSKGAVAAMTDANTFGTAIIGELNAFKLGVSDVDHVSDVFFNTVKRGVVNGQELAANLGLVAQNAKAAGIDVDQLGAMIAAVTKEGGPAAQNINNLNNLLEKMYTKEATAAFKELGIQVADASGKLRSPIDILTDLRAKLVTYTQAAAISAEQKIFPDLQARSGALVIMNELSTVRDALKENEDSSGSAAQAYETMAATFQTQSQMLGQAIKSVFTSGGNALLPVMTSAVSGVQGFVKDTAPLFDQWQTRLNNAFKKGGFDAWLKELGDVAGELGKQIEKWVPQFAGWLDKAKTTLWNTLNEVWSGTIVPWILQKKDELGKQMELWRDEFVVWWNSPETQTMLKQKLNAFMDVVDGWATKGGEGFEHIATIGANLGNALVNAVKDAITTGAMDWFSGLPQGVQDILKGKFGVFPQQTPPIAPFTPPGGASSPGASSPSAPNPTGFSLSSPNLIPFQYGLDNELTASEMAAACGPAAAVGFARIFGRQATLREALDIAKAGPALWDPVSGMHGADSEVALLGRMGITAHAEHGDVDWAKIQAAIAAGNPAIISTGQHYFEAQGYNAQTGQYNFGNSGRVYGPQNQWMTPAEMAAHGGVGTASIFMDSTRGAAASSPGTNGPVDYHALARAFATQYGVDPKIYEAMLQEEHGFQTDTTPNSAGARGIAQFMPGTAVQVAGHLGISTDQFWSDPKYQVQGGALYLKQLMDQFGGDPAKALAAYNFGEGNVASGKPIPDETSAYVQRILAAARGGPAVVGQTLGVSGPSQEELDALNGTKSGANPDEGVIGGGTEDPYKFSPEKFQAALDKAGLDAAASKHGAAIMDSLTKAIEGGHDGAIAALAGTMQDMHKELLSDQGITPEQAQARFVDLMSHITDAVNTGTPEAMAALTAYVNQFDETLQVEKIQAAADKKRADLQKNADKAIALAETARDKSIAALATNKENAIADRDAEQAESDRIAKSVEGAKQYVKAQEDQLEASHALQTRRDGPQIP